MDALFLSEQKLKCRIIFILRVLPVFRLNVSFACFLHVFFTTFYCILSFSIKVHQQLSLKKKYLKNSFVHMSQVIIIQIIEKSQKTKIKKNKLKKH